MSAAATQQTPVVPPHPSRATEKEDSTGTAPKIPSRPVNRRLERSVSPNPARFAPSPLSCGVISKETKATPFGQQYTGHAQSGDPVDRPGSVNLPSLGEEGQKYSNVACEVGDNVENASSPEQTRTVGEDLKLHAPRPSLPAVSAKQQVMAVTRTDSDRAASFGIGKPASLADDRATSRSSYGNHHSKRPSSTSAHNDQQQYNDEHGIPEIGQRVPMNPNLGDVQAPSPSPGTETAKKNHGRKHSARGLPPGSYGLHGHGVAPQDKLEKAYYQKRPEVLDWEQHTPLHDPQNDFAMSSSDLNKLVRDTASRQAALGATDIHATPAPEVAFQASEEYTSRIISRPVSAAAPKDGCTGSTQEQLEEPIINVQPDTPIHVSDARHPEYYQYGDEDNTAVDDDDEEYHAPILASDEVQKDANAGLQQPAIRPHLERRGSSLDNEEASSRPTSRPASIRVVPSQPEFSPTPLEDVEEYEPLFSEETKEEKPPQEAADENDDRHHFPSKDLWEDAPSSVHYTTTVSTPDIAEKSTRRVSHHEDRPITPAHAFAQYQEQLAEEEANGRTSQTFAANTEERPWIDHQTHLRPSKPPRPAISKRFPSRNVWEDAPESQLQEAVLSGRGAHEHKTESSTAPTNEKGAIARRPTVQERPKPRQGSGDDTTKPRPPVSEKPKPQIPSRAGRSGPNDPSDVSTSKPKLPVPSRPTGNKIAALQAGFMNDLNKRLQLGPQAPKKEDSILEGLAKPNEGENEREQPVLSDARKGRARGPQRRAPARSLASPTNLGTDASPTSKPVLVLCPAHISWTIDPNDSVLAAFTEDEEAATTKETVQPPVDPTCAKQDPQQASNGVPTQGSSTDDKLPQEESVSKPEADPKDLEASGCGAAGAADAAEPPREEMKTFITKMAGESVLEVKIKKDEAGDVAPVEVHDVVDDCS